MDTKITIAITVDEDGNCVAKIQPANGTDPVAPEAIQEIRLNGAKVYDAGEASEDDGDAQE